MIHLSQPEIRSLGAYARLQATVTIDGVASVVWFQVEQEYEPYLCAERADAFIIGCLNFAMRNGHDIVSDAPINEDLYYQLDNYLIDAIAQGSHVMHRTKITAPVDSSTLPCANAVGTGVSCGVDSMYSIACEQNLKFTNHNITHLAFNNVGSHGEGELAEKLFQQRKVQARQFAEEHGYKFVEGNSNIMDVIQQSHYLTHTFTSVFAIYALQKLYAIYYYPSGAYRYSEYSFDENERHPSCRYEHISLPMFSTHALRIYSQGDNMSRLQKIKRIMQYEPSHTSLNVCLREQHNCSKCEKCLRTILELDALGALESYKAVFDVDYYRAHRNHYFKKLLIFYHFGKDDYIDLYPYFKWQIPIYVRIWARLSIVRYTIIDWLHPHDKRIW